MLYMSVWAFIGVMHRLDKYMGESFQDYSWFEDFDADFPQKVTGSLKMLN